MSQGHFRDEKMYFERDKKRLIGEYAVVGRGRVIRSGSSDLQRTRTITILSDLFTFGKFSRNFAAPSNDTPYRLK